MQTLSSVLTLSKDFDYGELVRMSYDLRPVDTCFFPVFEEAISLVKAMGPEAVLLHLDAEDFAEAVSFLKQLVEVQQEDPCYAPKVLISTATYAILQEKLVNQHTLSFLTEGPMTQDNFITFEEFSVEVLIELLDLTLQSPQECDPYSFNRFLSTSNLFDSMVPAPVC